MKKEQLGMPIQCIQTKQALVDVYGEERALKLIDKNIDSLSEAFKLIPKTNLTLRMNISVQADFWSQTKEAVSHMELLKEAKEKLYLHNVDPLTQKLDEKSPDYDFIKLLDTLID